MPWPPALLSQLLPPPHFNKHTQANAPLLGACHSWAQRHGKLFIPSVGPGYADARIRPWNVAATRVREGGARYRRWFEAALAAGPAAVSITSYNEWVRHGDATQTSYPTIPPHTLVRASGHIQLCPALPLTLPHTPRATTQGEGTQIEPARVHAAGDPLAGGADYISYGPSEGQDEWLYLNLTLRYAQQLQLQQQQRQPARGAGDGGAQAAAGDPHAEL